eukprot:COSAG06_NODE_584_length_14005_cov_23.423486_15_plen_307_part_00
MPGFGRAHPPIKLLEDNAVAEKTKNDDSYRAAASEATLSGGGLHVARFTVGMGSMHESYTLMFFGVIGADWNVQRGEGAHNVQGHCFYYTTYNGRRYPGSSDWEGMQGAREGDRIDLLLDLSAGSMSVFKNGEPLGVMQESGLGGAGVEYRWAVSLFHYGDSARIDAVPAAEVEAVVQARDAQQERERLEREAQREREREEREAQQERERERQAQREWENLARIASQQDLALPTGTRLRVHGHASDGVYVRWECRTSSATCCAPPPTYAHFIDFGGGAQQVALKGLSWSGAATTDSDSASGGDNRH